MATMYGVRCTVYCVRWVVHGVRCTMERCTVHHTLYGVHCMVDGIGYSLNDG